MNKQYLKVPACISALRTMADGCLRLTVDANELPADEVAAIFGVLKQPITVLVVPGEGMPELGECPPKPPSGGKPTPSQRLRMAIYVKFRKSGDDAPAEFDLFYEMAMERIIWEVSHV